MTNPSFDFRPSGLIEFEHVEPEVVARQVNTAADDSQDKDPLSINFERRKDTKATPAERMLAGPTIDWLVAFPIDARPKALCERYPHVANRLARDWTDPSRVEKSLQLLVDDARWGSTGFPALVQSELKRLLLNLPKNPHSR